MHIHWIYWIQIRLHKIFTGYSQVVHERIQGMVQMISLTSPAVLGASLSSSEPVWMDGDVPWSKQLTPLPTHNVYIHVFLTHIQVTGRFLSFFELLPKCCRMYYIHRLVLYTSYFPGVQLLLYIYLGPLSLCMYVYIYICVCMCVQYIQLHTSTYIYILILRGSSKVLSPKMAVVHVGVKTQGFHPAFQQAVDPISPTVARCFAGKLQIQQGVTTFSMFKEACRKRSKHWENVRNTEDLQMHGKHKDVSVWN